MKKIRYLKGKMLGTAGSLSGTASILGSWQICHNVCLGLIGLLSVVGITITGMPLAFLTKVAVPFWSAAVVLLGITAYFYFRKKCISKNLLIINLGLIIAGTPFKALEFFSTAFWTVGGAFAVTGIILVVKEKLKGGMNTNKNYGEYFVYSLLFVVVAGLLLALMGVFDGASITAASAENFIENGAAENSVQGTSLKTVSTGSTGQGDVAIDLRPSFVDGKLVVKISANTHYVDLSQFDLKQITTLSYEGRVIYPSSVPLLKGHHSSGKLEFDVGEEKEHFMIKIKGIPLVEERVFSW